ncbi:hypothetical protein C1645_817679 [Glomus cerebriforme]|uniref:Uncharacterized protein n=1 Tax=Glomus cerebriforme TaxID=658196 RepID=A0A397T8R9_9GLOM|nr:hypothetical protein C1645_817679 [Glomus cerebriforme]
MGGGSSNGSSPHSYTEPNEIDVKKCIKYVACTWDNVTNTTIKNCWLKADIMPEYGEPSDIKSIDCKNYKNNANILLELKHCYNLNDSNDINDLSDS